MKSFYRNEINDIKLFENQLKGELTIVISEKKKRKYFDKEKLSTKQKNI